MKKDDPKRKKKKLPFYGRAYGGAARARADRKAYRRGGAVSKADVDPISPTEPNAPAGGKVLQQFKKGGVAKRQDGGGAGDEFVREVGLERLKKRMTSPESEKISRFQQGQARNIVDTMRPRDFGGRAEPPLRKRGGGVAKRADGGGDDDKPTMPGVPKSSSVADLTSAGLNPLLPALGAGDLGGGTSLSGINAPPAIPAGMPGGAPGPVPAFAAPPPPALPAVDGGGARMGMRRGGGVKKRADGGDIRKPIPDDWRRLGPEPPPPPPREEPKPSWLEREYQKGTAVFGPKNTIPPRGGGAQVPNLGEQEKNVKQPGIGSAVKSIREKLGFKSGGTLSAAQRQSLPRSDFALPGRGSGPKGAGSGSYPINDRSHARNALARSSGKPVAAQVRAKVKAKYPDMGD